MNAQEASEAINRFVLHGLPPGGCLRAIIANDLFEAVLRADSSTFENLRTILGTVNQWVPPEARGSYEAHDRWLVDESLRNAVLAARAEELRRRSL